VGCCVRCCMGAIHCQEQTVRFAPFPTPDPCCPCLRVIVRCCRPYVRKLHAESKALAGMMSLLPAEVDIESHVKTIVLGLSKDRNSNSMRSASMQMEQPGMGGQRGSGFGGPGGGPMRLLPGPGGQPGGGGWFKGQGGGPAGGMMLGGPGGGMMEPYGAPPSGAGGWGGSAPGGFGRGGGGGHWE
jgi:hypothetical protein